MAQTTKRTGISINKELHAAALARLKELKFKNFSEYSASLIRKDTLRSPAHRAHRAKRAAAGTPVPAQ